jgi:sugar lactone lactonase YvrE
LQRVYQCAGMLLLLRSVFALWSGIIAIRAARAGEGADAYAFSTMAGGHLVSYRDGPANVARFASPNGLAFGPDGFLYVADTVNLCIRRIAPDGTVTTFAGDPGSRQVRIDGALAVSRFSGPKALTFDAAGNMLVADGPTVRMITTAGIVSTLATDVQPSAIAISPSGEIHIAEGGHGSIRKVSPDGKVTDFVGVYWGPGNADGIGTAARFSRAADIVFDKAGNLFVADSNNNAIRRVTPDGAVSTVATLSAVNGVTFDIDGNLLATSYSFPVVWKMIGTRLVSWIAGAASLPNGTSTGPVIGHVDGPNGVGQLGHPARIAVGPTGIIYVSTDCIRSIDRDGTLTTFAGVGRPLMGVDGSGAEARFVSVDSVAADHAGNVYVSDAIAHVIRKISPGNVVTTFAGIPGRSGYRDGDSKNALFLGPDTVSVAPDGTLYVMDRGSLRRVASDGSITTHIGVYASQPAFRSSIGRGSFTIDPAGHIYIFDSLDCVIRKIAPTGEVSILTGEPNQSGFVDGPATVARFGRAGKGGIAVGHDGSLYVSDTLNSAVRKISPSGFVTTLFAAKPPSNEAGSIGTTPNGVVVEPSGSVLVVFDRTFKRITANGTIQDVPGSPVPLGDIYDGYTIVSGSAGYLNELVGLKDGTVFVSDPWNGTILRGVQRPRSRLSNLSMRAPTGPGEDTLIAGFALRGAGIGRMLLRGIGPTLSQFGVGGSVADPQITVFDAAGHSRGHNDNWGGSDAFASLFTSMGAFALPPASRDAALMAELTAGTFTTHLGSTTKGAALMEVYSQDGADSPRLVNLSGRSTLPANSSISSGFSISGEATKTVLIRGLGPALRFFGIVPIGNPRLRLFDADGQLLAEDNGWSGVQRLAGTSARVGAFPLQPGDRDAGLIMQLSPGTYSVELSNPSGNAGGGMIEIYDADP